MQSPRARERPSARLEHIEDKVEVIETGMIRSAVDASMNVKVYIPWSGCWIAQTARAHEVVGVTKLASLTISRQATVRCRTSQVR